MKRPTEVSRIIATNDDIGFNLTDDDLIRKIFVDKLTQVQLISDRLAIVRLSVDNNNEGEYAIIPTSAANEAAQRDASNIALYSALNVEERDGDDSYTDFRASDDLMW